MIVNVIFYNKASTFYLNRMALLADARPWRLAPKGLKWKRIMFETNAKNKTNIKNGCVLHSHEWQKILLRPNNSRLQINDLTCASRYVERTRGFRSPPGGPTNLPRPFLIVNWWLPREPRRKLNGEPGKLRLAWKILKTASCHKMGKHDKCNDYEIYNSVYSLHMKSVL
jgi:hypothetical protein